MSQAGKTAQNKKKKDTFEIRFASTTVALKKFIFFMCEEWLKNKRNEIGEKETKI